MYLLVVHLLYCLAKVNSAICKILVIREGKLIRQQGYMVLGELIVCGFFCRKIHETFRLLLRQHAYWYAIGDHVNACERMSSV
jgi:hypothetical protein